MIHSRVSSSPAHQTASVGRDPAVPGFARIIHALVTICTSEPPTTPGAHPLAPFLSASGMVSLQAPNSPWPGAGRSLSEGKPRAGPHSGLVARPDWAVIHADGPSCWDSADLKPAPWLERGPAIPGVRTPVAVGDKAGRAVPEGTGAEVEGEHYLFMGRTQEQN